MKNGKAERPQTKSKEAYCLMMYEGDDGSVEWLWNSRDGVTPFCLDMKTNMQHVHWQMDVFAPYFVPPVGMRVFVDLTPEHAEVIAERRVMAARGTEYEVADEVGLKAELVRDLTRGGEPHIVTVDAALQARFAERARRLDLNA